MSYQRVHPKELWIRRAVCGDVGGEHSVDTPGTSPQSGNPVDFVEALKYDDRHTTMRYSPDHKKATHDAVVAAASRAFRADGVSGVGIARLMKDAGLTHGGFYAHFDDKDALVAESLSFAVDESIRILGGLVEREGLEGVINLYLSEMHRDHPSKGCPLPSLSAEVGRSSKAMRDAFADQMQALFRVIERELPGPSEEERKAQAVFIFASMAGAVALSRACRGTSLSRFILESTKTRLAANLKAVD